MNLPLAARRESATTTWKNGRLFAPPRRSRITTIWKLRAREKARIIRENPPAGRKRQREKKPGGRGHRAQSPGNTGASYCCCLLLARAAGDCRDLSGAKGEPTDESQRDAIGIGFA